MSRIQNTLTITEFIHRAISARPKPKHRLSGRADRCALHLTGRIGINLGHQLGSPRYYFEADLVTISPLTSLHSWHPFRRSTRFAIDLMHEAIHWTGFRTRLNRQLTADQDTDRYAREELVAEMGSAFICHDLGITNRIIIPHATYLNNWISNLPNPSVELKIAETKANQAARYLVSLYEKTR